ncbi:MAG: hypothetical protein H7061_07770 [Bdellovibrionaceae bacterium]|nr:hypothetical protein [Bdellovibrio sp.]
MKVVQASVRASVLAFILVFSSFVFANPNYPDGPNPSMTPGSLCQRATEHRYAEQIPYCERDVSSDLKQALIARYDHDFGFHIQTMDRGEFKIDHFIPLSIGGSNTADNLWPQHRSVYGVTDPLEQLLSDKMSAGRLKQAEAIRIVREAKLNLGRVPELIHYLRGM